MLNFQKKSSSGSDGVNLLASILVCYGEVTTVSYEPKDETIELTFTLKSEMEEGDFNALCAFIGESIHTYHTLEGYFPERIDFSLEAQGSLSFFHITRDLATVSRGELALVTSIMRERFPEELFPGDQTRERADADFAAAQEEALSHILDSAREARPAQRMVGIREEGRVVVFNR